MTNQEAIQWLQNFRADIGEPQTSHLWHYEPVIDEIINVLKNQSETRQTKYGEWITTTMQALNGNVCSACHQTANGIFYKTKYCPNCGAKMEK